MHLMTSYDTKLNPHKPSLSGGAWLCHQSALLPGAFFSCPTSELQRAIRKIYVVSPTQKASDSSSSHRKLSVAGLRSTGDLLGATQPLSKALLINQVRKQLSVIVNARCDKELLTNVTHSLARLAEHNIKVCSPIGSRAVLQFVIYYLL